MCRSQAEGGRRCPSDCNRDHYSNSSANRAARQQLSRMRHKLAEAEAAADSAAISRYEIKLADAERRVEASRPPRGADAAATRVQAVPEAQLAGAPPTPAEATPHDVVLAAARAVNGGALPSHERLYRLADLRAAMPAHLSRSEVDDILRKLSRDKAIDIVPDSNRKTLTDADHAAAINIGGEPNHLVSIQAPVDRSALQRVLKHGVSAASDEDLEHARHDDATSTNHPDLYDAISAERRRRQQSKNPATNARASSSPATDAKVTSEI